VKNRIRVFGCLVVMQVCGIAAAAETDRPLIGPPPDWVQPERSDPVTPAASEAPVQVLLSDQQVRMTTEAVETYVATRMKIQNRQGLDALGTLGFTWKPDSDVLTVHQLSLVRDGQAQDLLDGGAAFTVLRREDQLERAVITGMLTAVIQPAGLRVGDVIEMQHTLRRRDPVVHDSPDAFHIWGGGPVSNARLRVLWPESLPMRWKASSHMPAGEPVKNNGWYELTYQLDEVVPLLQPTGAPGRFAALRSLELTTFQDWQALSRRLAPLYVEASKLGAASPLRAEADRIRRQHATPADRAAAALRLVQDEIRYVLLAMNDGGLKPAAIDETWQRRFGDCKAKSVVLLALLRELGIEAEVVAVSTAFGDGLDARLPGIVKFDHVLVRAMIGGKAYWLDGTRTGDRALARLQPPPYRWALPLTQQGSGLIPIPLEPLEAPTAELSLQVDATKGVSLPASFKAEMKMTGDAAQSLRLNLETVPEANREEYLRTFWRRVYRGVEIEATGTSFDDAQGLLTWTASGSMKMEWDPEYNTYEPHDMGVGYRADFSRPRGTDAAAPYLVDFPVHRRTIETIKLPPQRAPFTVTGSDINRTLAGVRYQRTARVSNDEFTAELIYRSVAPEFPASERAEVERVLLELSRNTLYLKKPDNYLPSSGELRAEAEQGFDEADDYFTLGLDMMQRGLREEANTAFSKALELDPKYAPAHIGLAGLLTSQGNINGAIAALEAALVEIPGNARLQEQLATLWVRVEQWPKALALFDEMMIKDPGSKLRARRAWVYHKMGDPKLAASELDAAIAADPKAVDSYLVKARIIQDTRRPQDIPALEAITKKNLGPEDIAAVKAALGRPDALRPAIEEDLRVNPTALGYMARAGLQKEKSAKIADYEMALKQADTTADTGVQVAMMLMAHLWYRETVDVLSVHEREKPLHPRAVGLRGVARWKLGDQAGARKDFAAARAGGAATLNNLCWDKASRKVALDEALRECDDALAAGMDCERCMDSRALVLLQLGRLRESVESYDRALQQRPDEPHSLFGRGLARIRLGDREAGDADLAAARKVWPAVDAQFEEMGLLP
jgi:tetratricopeptide (TPR) repeat protein/transglutaminase-like putative cysteine protease